MNCRDIFHYDPDTGKLFWKVTKSNRAVAGTEAGCLTSYGYLTVRLSGRSHLVHRIIWDLSYPDDNLKEGDEIDHIDHDGKNNKLSNLRKVAHLSNMRNLPLSAVNKSGVMGVGWRERDKRWRAFISVQRVHMHLGYFKSFEDAVAARKAAEFEYGFHENHGAKNEAQK